MDHLVDLVHIAISIFMNLLKLKIRKRMQKINANGKEKKVSI